MKILKLLPVLCLSLGIMVACSDDDPTPPMNPFPNTSWKFVGYVTSTDTIQLTKEEIQEDLPEGIEIINDSLSIAFESDSQVAFKHITFGENAGYTIDYNNKISLSKTTEIGTEPIGEIEKEYYKLISAIDKFEIKNDKLNLYFTIVQPLSEANYKHLLFEKK